MNINAQQIHIWQANLITSDEVEQNNLALLSKDEIERAFRLYFPIHRRRFIASRSMLRQVLALYLDTPPQDIVFAYDEYRKPTVKKPNTALRFNLSHSHDLAVYAVTLDHEIGIDIEKIADDYNPLIAQKYFSAAENNALSEIDNKTLGFFRIWARKEALIKAIGKGIAILSNSFSVPTGDEPGETIVDQTRWTIFPLDIDTHFEASLATRQSIDSIEYFQLVNQIPQLDRRIKCGYNKKGNSD